MKRKYGLFVIPLLAVSSLVGCKKKGGEPEPSPEPKVISITGASEWGVHGIATYTSSVEGVTWTSSNTSVATISETGELVGLSAGTTTLTASKEGYESATLAVSIIENPYSFSEEELGWYYGGFLGEKGTLLVQSTVAAYQDGDAIRTLFPTKLVDEEHSYHIKSSRGVSAINETYKVLYFESKFNDTDYRLRFTETEFKQMLLEKKVDGEFVEISEYHPTGFTPFSGAYNGVDGSLNPNNLVYIYTDKLVDAGEGHIGYAVRGYFEAYAQYSEVSFINELGYSTISGVNGSTSYELSFQTFDLSDGEYFEGASVIDPESANLLFAGSSTISWYADPTPFLTDIYDEDGNELFNYYDEKFEGGYEFVIDYEEYSLEMSRDENGVKYLFTADELEPYEARISSSLSFKHGEDTKAFGLGCTLLKPEWYEDQTFENPENTSTFTYYWDTDYETWEDVLVIAYKGDSIEESALSKSITGDGFVNLKFEHDEKEILVSKLTSAMITVSVDGGEAEKHVSRKYISELFDYTFTNGIMELEIDSSSHKAYLNESPLDVTFGYDPYWNKVVANFAHYTLVELNDEAGFYGMFNNEDENQSLALITQDIYESLYGQYTADGEHVIELSSSGIRIDGTRTNWMLTAFSTQTEILPGFMFMGLDGSIMMLVPGFDYTMGLYSISDTGGLLYEGSLVEKKIGDSFIGKYVMGSKDALETIEFTQDYKFIADTYDQESGELVPQEYDYAFSVEEGIAYINVDAGVGVAKFTKLEQALYLNGLLYMNPALYNGQGIYKSSDNTKAVSIWQNRISYSYNSPIFGRPITTVTEEIESISESSDESGTVYTISCGSNRVFTLTLDENHEFVKFEVDGEEWERVADDLFAKVLSGASATATINATKHVFQFAAPSYNSYNNQLNLPITYDGLFSDSGADGLRIYIDGDGHVCALYCGPGLNVKLYVNGTGELVAEQVK